LTQHGTMDETSQIHRLSGELLTRTQSQAAFKRQAHQPSIESSVVGWPA
jgi:hypothetical protein